MPRSFLERQEVVGIFHAKRVILRLSVYSLAVAREKGSKRDAQSQKYMECDGMEGTHEFG